MRSKAILVSALILAGCSAKTDVDSRSTESVVASDGAASSGPGVAVTAAPGVAFTYEYLFRLPGQGIARAQEVHAQACEKLGIARCRITGMHYSVGEDPADVTATLDLKLEPSIARKFGTEGIDTIVKAGGKLGSADIRGVDAGAAIRTIDRSSDAARAELGEIEQKLAKLPAKTAERWRLAERADTLRQQLATPSSERRDQLDSLATTPMTFRYAASSAIPGFDSGAPLYTGYLIGKQSLFVALTVLIVVIGVGAPWLIFALLLGWLYRVSGLRALRRRRTAPDAA